MTRADKLEHFAELATFCPTAERVIYMDAGHPDNIRNAALYLDELSFLSSGDRADLVELWREAQVEPLHSKMLFNAAKFLKNKYESIDHVG